MRNTDLYYFQIFILLKEESYFSSSLSVLPAPLSHSPKEATPIPFSVCVTGMSKAEWLQQQVPYQAQS